MKAKALAAFLCLLMTIPLLEGCGKQTEPESAASAVESQAVSAKGIPEDVQQALQAALDAEPITIPAEEWTVDTICQATYINGKQLTIPCTLHDLGEGFEIVEDDEHQIIYNETLKRASGFLTYYGKRVAGFSVENCESPDDVLDAPLRHLLFSFTDPDARGYSPISCNGATLGSTMQVSKERLFFMDVRMQDEETGVLSINKEIDTFRISCTCEDNKLTVFSIYFNTEN